MSSLTKSNVNVMHLIEEKLFIYFTQTQTLTQTFSEANYFI
jgi:hypothetical protein